MSEQIVPYAKWSKDLADLHQRYTTADPYPHIVLDGFLDPEVLEDVLAEFPAIDSQDWLHYKHVNENKFGRNDRSTIGPVTNRIFDELNSERFTRFLSALTGIPNLIPDPALQGGGLHQSGRGGFLNIHADFTVHPYHHNWQRRVNLLIYLNKNWDDSYGGHLELWDQHMRRCGRKVAPIFNRCVIFNTDADSFHGFPDPITCPDDVTRQSLALYYFTQETEPVRSRSTEYRARPGEGIRAVWIYLDKMALRLYHNLKSRLGIGDQLGVFVLRILSRLKGK